MYCNYREIKHAIEYHQNFKCNSAYAIITEKGYTIYSYTTVIYSDKTGLNIDYFSVTTSKLQNIIAQTYYNKTIQQLRKEKQVGKIIGKCEICGENIRDNEKYLELANTSKYYDKQPLLCQVCYGV